MVSISSGSSTNANFLSIFIFVSLTYAVFVFFLRDKINEKLMTYSYISITFILQFILGILEIRKKCGALNTRIFTNWVLLPWIFMFGLFLFLLTAYPGWTAPFTNTIGLLIIKFLGGNSIMNKLLLTPEEAEVKGGETKRLMSMMKEMSLSGNSIILNNLTPYNYDAAMKSMSGMFNTNSASYHTDYIELKKLIEYREFVGKLCWYLLIGVMTATVSMNGIVGSRCQKSLERLEEENQSMKTMVKQQEEEGDIME